VVNKTDLAPYGGAGLDTMTADTRTQRTDLPFVFTGLTTDDGIRPVADRVTECVAARRAGVTR
jgi:urease accessory protein